MRNYASELLLDSYNAERQPVIHGVIKTTDLLTKAMATPSKIAQRLRDTVFPVISRLPAFQQGFVKRLSGLGISYRGSPIVDGAGMRYFDDSLRGGEGLVNQFLLLHSGNAASRMAVHEFAESFRNILELRFTPGEDMTLVRPDGYVAYVAHNGKGALTSVRSLLECQTNSAMTL